MVIPPFTSMTGTGGLHGGITEMSIIDNPSIN